jgi:AraC-like DNA-binding protein
MHDSAMKAHHIQILKSTCRGIDAVDAISDRAFPKHTHDQYGIGYIRSGAQRSASDEGPVEAAAGNIIMVNPGEVHDSTPLRGEPRSWRMLYFDPDVMERACVDFDHACGQPHLPAVLKDEALACAFSHLFENVATGDVERSTEETLLFVIARLLHAQDRPVPRCPTKMQQVRRQIMDDLERTVPLRDLAHEIGISPFQLLRGFQKATGLTPHAFRIQQRLSLCRDLIRGHTPLAEAALQSGFADQSHMTRLFVRTFGYTPGHYATSFA